MEHPRFFAAPSGHTLAYRSWPADAAPTPLPSASRATIVLLHGWGDHGGRYAPLGQALAAAGFSCLALDLCGHGQSEGARARVHDLAPFLADLHAFLSRHAATMPLFLCGHSMGGLLSAHYALRHPTRVAGVLFHNAALAVSPKVSRLKRLVSMLVGATWPTLPMGILKQPQHMARSCEAQQHYRDDPLVHHGAIDAGTGRCLLLAARAFERARRDWRHPCLVLQGSADELVAPCGGRALQQSAPELTSLREFPGARHDLGLELGFDVLAREMIVWLEEQTRPRAATTC